MQAIVRRCSEFLDGLPKEKQVELILALQTVTEGKLFVEIDRARLTKRLAHIYEQDGDVRFSVSCCPFIILLLQVQSTFPQPVSCAFADVPAHTDMHEMVRR